MSGRRSSLSVMPEVRRLILFDAPSDKREDAQTSEGIEAHFARMRRVARERNYTVVAELRETGHSRAGGRGPALERALRMLECGQADGIMAVREDRLGGGHEAMRRLRARLLALDPVREADLRLLLAQRQDGVSAGSIAHDLNQRGIKPLRGGKWTATSVLRIARHPVVRKLLPEQADRTDRAKTGRRAKANSELILHRLLINELAVYEPHMLLQGHVQMAGQPGRYPSYKAHLPGHVRGKPSYRLLPAPGKPAVSFPAQVVNDHVLNALEERAKSLDIAALMKQCNAAIVQRQQHSKASAAAQQQAVVKLRGRLDKLLNRIDAALDARLLTRAAELDKQAEALRQQIEQAEVRADEIVLEADTSAEVDNDTLNALQKLNLVAELRRLGAWDELREIVNACLSSISCALYRRPETGNELHGTIRLHWKPLLDIPPTGGNVSFCTQDDTLITLAKEKAATL